MVEVLKQLLDSVTQLIGTLAEIGSKRKESKINEAKEIEECYTTILNNIINFFDIYSRFLREREDIAPEAEELKNIPTLLDKYVLWDPADIETLNSFDNGINKEKEIAEKLANDKEYNDLLKKYDIEFEKEYKLYLREKNKFNSLMRNYKRISRKNMEKVDKEISNLFEIIENTYELRYQYFIRESEFRNISHEIIRLINDEYGNIK